MTARTPTFPPERRIWSWPAKAIDGTILNPGEEFSFNGVVGERTKAKGL